MSTIMKNKRLGKEIAEESQLENLKNRIYDLESQIKELRTECAINKMRYNAAICEVERLRGKINGRNENLSTL